MQSIIYSCKTQVGSGVKTCWPLLYFWVDNNDCWKWKICASLRVYKGRLHVVWDRNLKLKNNTRSFTLRPRYPLAEIVPRPWCRCHWFIHCVIQLPLTSLHLPAIHVSIPVEEEQLNIWRKNLCGGSWLLQIRVLWIGLFHFTVETLPQRQQSGKRQIHRPRRRPHLVVFTQHRMQCLSAAWQPYLRWGNTKCVAGVGKRKCKSERETAEASDTLLLHVRLRTDHTLGVPSAVEEIVSTLTDESRNRQMGRNTQHAYLIELSCQHGAVTNISTSCNVSTLSVLWHYQMLTFSASWYSQISDVY
jgi:hypothetical protein